MRLTAIRDTLLDVRYAWRQLRHAPGFTSIAVLTLALGVGAATSIMGILDALTTANRPTVSLDGVFSLVKRDTRSAYVQDGLLLNELRDLETHPMPGVAEMTTDGVSATVTVQQPGRAELVPAHFVPETFGRFFALNPQAGRWIGSADNQAGANQVAIISDRLWREWFGGNPDIIGRASLRINLKPFAIIGIAPKGIRTTGDLFGMSDVWLPLTSFPAVYPDHVSSFEQRWGMPVFVRARPGITAAQLAGQARTRLPSVTFPTGPLATPTPAIIDVVPARTRFRFVSDTREAWLATALAGLILIAACANLANLVYARGLQRTAEVAVRASLGASTGRLFWLFVAETGIIAALASSAGLAMALGIMRLFAIAVPAFQLNRFNQLSIDFSPDLKVFLYAFTAGAMAALVVGVTTTWRVSRVPPLRVLAGSGAGSGMTAQGARTRTALVAIQITAAVLVVMVASVTVEQFRQDRARGGPTARPRYDEARLASVRVNLELLKYNETRGRAFYDELIARARTLPDVEGAAITSSLWGGSPTNLEPEPPPAGRIGNPTLTRAYTARVSPGYLKTLGLPLTRGRDLTPFDTDGAPKVALVSESAVAHLFPRGDDPIGKRVKFGPWDWLTIVGVTADPVSSSDTGPTRPSNAIYIPFAQWYQPSAQLVVRSASPSALLEPLGLTVNAINPDVAVFEATTGENYTRMNRGVSLAFDALITGLGVVALGIAMLGVYGVVAFFVTTRRREFGIRLALGATPGRVVKLVVDHAIHVVLVGLLPGVFLASIGARFAQAQYRGFTPMDITTWFVVPAFILAAGVVAGYVPARRAARVDPNVALRDL